MTLTANDPPSTFFEEFTHTKSWIYVDYVRRDPASWRSMVHPAACCWVVVQKVSIPTSGIYYFVAYPTVITLNHDKLWMVIGTKERFGLKELFSFGKIIKYVQNFHENK